MAAPRNNYSRLPWEIRRRILGMLHDGAEQSEVLSDPIVRVALDERQSTLHSTTFLAIKRSEEYKEYVKMCVHDSESRRADKISAAMLENSASLADLTDVARYELAKQVRDLLSDTSDLSDMSDRIKAARSLSQSLSALSQSSAEKKLAEKDAEITALKKEIADLNAAHEAEIARLVEQQSGSIEKGVSEETLRKVEQNIKLL